PPFLHSSLLISRTTPRPPWSTPFPYTTLFRSVQPGQLQSCRRVLGEVLRQVAAGQRPSGQGQPARHQAGHDQPPDRPGAVAVPRSEEHTSELQSREKLVCRLLLEKKKERTEVQ